MRVIRESEECRQLAQGFEQGLQIGLQSKSCGNISSSKLKRAVPAAYWKQTLKYPSTGTGAADRLLTLLDLLSTEGHRSVGAPVKNWHSALWLWPGYVPWKLRRPAGRSPDSRLARRELIGALLCGRHWPALPRRPRTRPTGPPWCGTQELADELAVVVYSFPAPQLEGRVSHDFLSHMIC